MDLQNSYAFRVFNGRTKDAYVQLLSPSQDWDKDLVVIDVPEMQDPTIGRLRDYDQYLAQFRGKQIAVDTILLWCPGLGANLDLFTLHIYEAIPGQPDQYANLRIIHPHPEEDVPRSDILYILMKDFVLTEHTRISFIVPAFNKMVLELFVETEPGLPI